MVTLYLTVVAPRLSSDILLWPWAAREVRLRVFDPYALFMVNHRIPKYPSEESNAMRLTIKEIFELAPDGRSVTIKGWVRTKRETKAAVFLEVNDGSRMGNMQ
jgi:hypothetical protein